MFLRPGGGPLFFEAELDDNAKLLFCFSLVLEDYLKPKPHISYSIMPYSC